MGIKRVPGSALQQCVGHAYVPFAGSEVFSLYKDIDLWNKWDKTWAYVNVLQELDEYNTICHLMTTTPWPVTKRDFVEYRCCWAFPDEGVHIVFFRNAEHPGAPAGKNGVRGETLGLIGYAMQDCVIPSDLYEDTAGSSHSGRGSRRSSARVSRSPSQSASVVTTNSDTVSS